MEEYVQNSEGLLPVMSFWAVFTPMLNKNTALLNIKKLGQLHQQRESCFFNLSKHRI